jgi:hypothetical protein
MNWILFFSVFALLGILPSDYYYNWVLFVEAMKLFCAKSITAAMYQKGKDKHAALMLTLSFSFSGQ